MGFLSVRKRIALMLLSRATSLVVSGSIIKQLHEPYMINKFSFSDCVLNDLVILLPASQANT